MTNILLVEDNEMNRDMQSRRLTKRGYVVVTAADGRQGIEMANKNRPDIILMDLNMPNIDGWEATRKLKAAPETSNIPIIAISAHAMPADRERAFEAGCDEYVSKPVDMNDLVIKIENLRNSEAAK